MAVADPLTANPNHNTSFVGNCGKAYKAIADFTAPFFKVTGAIFDGLKKAAGSFDGLLATSNLIIATNDLFGTLDLHVFKPFAELCDDFKTLKACGNIASVGDSFHKKPLWDKDLTKGIEFWDLVSPPEEKNWDWDWEMVLGILENCIKIAKRICLAAVSILGGLEFFHKIDWIADCSIKIGNVSINKIGRLIGTVLGFIENMFDFKHNYDKRHDTKIKISAMKYADNPEEMARLARLKPEKYMRIHDHKVKLIERCNKKFVEHHITVDESSPYIYLIYLKSLAKVLESIDVKEKELFNGLKAANGNGIEIAKLTAKINIVHVKLLDLKNRKKRLRSLVDTEHFAQYKLDQYEIRKKNLDVHYNKISWDTAANVSKIVVYGLGIAESTKDLERLTDFVGIEDEKYVECGLAGVSFFSASCGFLKHLYEEYNKEEQIELSIAVYESIHKPEAIPEILAELMV